MKHLFLSYLLLAGSFLRISETQAQCPISNTCTPGNATNSQASLFGGGIFQVRIGPTFTNSTVGQADGYKDYCSLGPINITLGGPVSVQIKTGNTFTENLRIFVDLNNDQTFSLPGELIFSSNNATLHSGTFTIPSGTTGQSLKLRISSDLITAAVNPGPCTTPEYSQVEDYAIVLVQNTNPPIAKFSVSDSITCDGTVSFTDRSVNNPNSWTWDFGDGMKSFVQNPSHAYQNSGSYTVKLKVTNGNGVDSLEKSNFIQYNDTVPAATICKPITFNQCCGYGISKVNFASISNSSGLGTYEDFTCSNRTTVLQGRSYPFQAFTNPNLNQDTKVWIDYNGNGIFETNELVFQSISSKNPSGTILISSDTSVKQNIGIRMRIMSEYTGAAIGPCTDLDKGQCEDYTLNIKENRAKPVALFTTSSANFCLPNYTFTSTSLNSVTSYHWYFGDGKDTLISTPTISYTYPSNGIFDVKLIVAGPFGNDTLLKVGEVSYLGQPTGTCSLLSQSGGPQLSTGIAEVSFGSILNRTGNSSDGYQNYSCRKQTTVKKGQSVKLTVKNSGRQTEKVQAWIDWNANGTLETIERVLNTQQDTVHTAFVLIPSNAVTGLILRLRVGSNLQQANQFGACGTIQVGQAEDYGVTVQNNIEKPIAAFGTKTKTSCSGIIQFIDSSQNIPTSYNWSFGDNQTSTEVSPLHAYSTTGLFTVRLITSNAFGADTLTKSNYINITALNGMAISNCNPPPNNTCCQYGIKQVIFAGINKTSGNATEGNKDFTCEAIGTAVVGTIQAISIVNSGNSTENVAVWIDWNNDGSFGTSEKAFSSNNALNHSGNINIPGNAVAGVGLRMRVKSDFSNQALTGPCQANQFGQYEDYQLVLQGNNQKPRTLFTASTTKSCVGIVSFQDTSFNAPNAWKWYFGDGDSSILRSPTHTYATLGNYKVTLIASNANGSDTLVKAAYISILNGENMKSASCIPETVILTGNQGIGIRSVTFNAILRTSPTAPTEGYVDASCLFRTNVSQGQSYQLTVLTSQNFPESCRAWIDWNNNGQFEDPAELVLNGRNSNTHTVSVAIPANAVTDTLLRMRVISDFGGGGGINLQPCSPPNYGQCEDYGILVKKNISKPVAKFSAFSRTACNGSIKFKDISDFIPSSWTWFFGDGTSSDLQNPLHEYTSIGQFDIKLKVSNDFGVDSITVPNFISITELTGTKSAICTNAVSNPGQNFGTSRVSFGTLNKASNFALADGGYLDYTCSDSGLVNITSINQSYPIVILTSNGQTRENCRVYIDFNNDGAFSDSESILNSPNNNYHTANIVLTEAQCLGVPVRMRVMTDNRNNTITSACYNPVQGQVEDYRMRLVWSIVSNLPTLSNIFKLSPNPSAGRFRINGSNQLKRISVTDLQGKAIADFNPRYETSEGEIDLSHLPNGMYQLQILSAQGIERKQIIIQK